MAPDTAADGEQRDALLLEEFLRSRIEGAMREFKPEPKTVMTWLAPRTPAKLARLLPRSVRDNPIEYRKVMVKGVSDSIALGLSAVVPAATIYAVGAKIGLDLFETYFNETFRGNLTASRTGADALSYKLVGQPDVAGRYKDKIAAMRHCIRATITAIAEFIELQETTLPQFGITELEPAKRRQVESFVDGTHRWRTSYRSVASALSLFVQENRNIVARIRDARAAGSKDTRSLLQLNAVFAFEVADVMVEFLRAFELQGIPELRRLHGEIKAEIVNGRNNLAALETKISSARSTQAISEAGATETTDNIARTRRALNLIQEHWDRLMERLDGSERSVSKVFAVAIQRLDIIKLEAETSLTVSGLIEVTDAVQGNFSALGDMLHEIDELKVMPITEEDVRLFLNIDTEIESRDTDPPP